jgi:hypothetical protein
MAAATGNNQQQQSSSVTPKFAHGRSAATTVLCMQSSLPLSILENQL